MGIGEPRNNFRCIREIYKDDPIYPCFPYLNRGTVEPRNRGITSDESWNRGMEESRNNFRRIVEPRNRGTEE